MTYPISYPIYNSWKNAETIFNLIEQYFKLRLKQVKEREDKYGDKQELIEITEENLKEAYKHFSSQKIKINHC